MFDGIDEVLLPASRIDDLMRLYVESMGFQVIDDDRSPDPAWQRAGDLPRAPTRAVVLGKPRSHGGWIRLLEVPGLSNRDPAQRPDRVGAYALDFYVRDADDAEVRIAAGSWDFLSTAVHYKLPGTDLDVRERMLDQTVSGLLHAIVQYRPRSTRCVIGHDESEDVSEVVAAVFLTDQFDDATAFAREVLGAEQYFTGRFEGPAVEAMLRLEPGEGLEGALFRGPTSRNARLEFARAYPDAAPPDEVPRVVAGVAVADLDALHTRLADDRHGVVDGPFELDGRRHLRLRSRYGAVFDFTEASRPIGPPRHGLDDA